MNIGQNNAAGISFHSSEYVPPQGRILYMDEYLAVFNKAAGDICEASPAVSAHTEENGCSKKPSENSNPYVPDIFCNYLQVSPFYTGITPSYIHCFNRLDRPVSGAVLLVFTPSLIPLLQQQFTAQQKKDGGVKKIYRAVLEGHIFASRDFELLEHYIRFDSKKQKAFVSDEKKTKTKLARLLWRPVFCTDRYTLAEIVLITGRTHQIRAQLAYRGYRIKGDVKYGARRSDNLGGIRLHAARLRFMHPVSGYPIDVHAPLLKTDPLWDICMRHYMEGDVFCEK